MKHSPRALTSLIKSAACAALLIGTVAHAQVNPTGKWTWTQAGRGGGPDLTNTLTLTYADGKLTGELLAPGGGGRRGGAGGAGGAPPAPMPAPISEGKVDGDKISFSVVRTFGQNSNTNKFMGTIAGDTITGTQEGGPGGRGGRRGGAGGAPADPNAPAPAAPPAPMPRPWTATRAK